MQYIEPLAKLIEHFRSLPGIGAKTAVRLAYHVLDMDVEKAKALAGAIIEAKEKIGFCNTCFNLSDTNPCAICASDTRDRSLICVVEQPRDVACGRFAFHVRIGREDDLLDAARLDALDKLVDADVVGSNAVHRREHTVQHVIFSVELTRALHGDDVLCVANHA